MQCVFFSLIQFALAKPGGGGGVFLAVLPMLLKCCYTLIVTIYVLKRML